MTFSLLNDVIKLAIFLHNRFPKPLFLKMTFLPKGSVLMALFLRSKLTALSDAAL